MSRMIPFFYRFPGYQDPGLQSPREPGHGILQQLLQRVFPAASSLFGDFSPGQGAIIHLNFFTECTVHNKTNALIKTLLQRWKTLKFNYYTTIRLRLRNIQKALAIWRMVGRTGWREPGRKKPSGPRAFICSFFQNLPIKWSVTKLAW